MLDETTKEYQLGQLREKRRSKGRITFDCFNAMVRGDRVYCKLGHVLSAKRDGGLTLVEVLRGRSSPTCRKCSDYDDVDQVEDGPG